MAKATPPPDDANSWDRPGSSKARPGGVRRVLRRLLWLLALLVLGTGGYLAYAHLSDGKVPTLGLPLGGSEAELRQKTLSFWEDIQFKDWKKAATYHDPGIQAQVDIPFLIKRTFAAKPETLDIMSYEVVTVHVDSSRLRARVKSRVKAMQLASQRVEEVEVMLFYRRTDERASWYMILEDDLRGMPADPNKKS